MLENTPHKFYYAISYMLTIKRFHHLTIRQKLKHICTENNVEHKNNNHKVAFN